MERFEISEDGPAGHQPIYLRATRAAVAAEKRALKRLGANLHIQHPKCTLFLAIFHAVHAIMVFFYAEATAHPLPRGVVNHTYEGLATFWFFMSGFGFMLGSIEGGMVVDALRRRYNIQRSDGRRIWFLASLGFWVISVVFATVLGLAGTVITEIAAAHSFRHACERDWTSVLLVGPDHKHRNSPYRATFSLSATKEPLFTFTSQDPDRWHFNLVSLNSTRPAVLPALRNITFDDPKLAVSGLCYGDNATAPCMLGRYDPIVYLSFDVTTNGTRECVRSPYRDWSLDDVLSVILRRVADDGTLSDVRILQTSTYKPGDCKQLKVCVAHPQVPTSVLGADILVAVGWLLGIQGEAAAKCTK
ncbi:hypothetical protein AURDEDRAFT_151652 [Auricularia subglabra TFB-10046 SS5]|nr:hypothetical protein AURDEDRAFT_151652 [Auricularia subglabra TFB-10046 SS5]